MFKGIVMKNTASTRKATVTAVTEQACKGLPATIACEDKVAKSGLCCGLKVGKCVSSHPHAEEKQEGRPPVSRMVRMTQVIQKRVAHA